jgi:outer membrane protein OmpA-like peptidoglycan-associated protein
MRRAIVLFLLCFAISRADAAAPPSQKFVVFFEEWSAKLDDAAQAVIGQAAAAAKTNAAPVHVEAFADPTGSKKANELLTDLRAQVVIDQLQADGVSSTRIVGRGHGSVHFALSSQESRRVEISFGGH